ncbi:MAG: type II toxin-antitoxin system RelE/ParE family toxin [Candidatus Hydrogenedentales bacterium]
MSLSRVYVRPRAKQDIIEQAEYIAASSLASAVRFLDELQLTFGALAKMPEMGAPRSFRNPALKKIRMWPVNGFEKHLIFYRPYKTGIDVIRVLYASRDYHRIFGGQR